MEKTSIQAQIAETIEQIVHLKIVNAQLEETHEELQKKYDQLEDINRQLGKELRDIEKLEGLSTTSIFHKILGNKEKQIEKERQEYLAITLKHEDLQNSIKLLEYEVDLLEAKVKSRAPLEKKLEQLKSLREQEILQHDPMLRGELLVISQNQESAYQLRKELAEAIEAGSVSLNLIDQTIHHLQRVHNWGSFNAPRGGHGRMYRMQQRDAIDRARNLSYQVRHHLQLFDRELRDIGYRLSGGIDTSQFTNFSDFFFNNIITDWIMRQKLTAALGSVSQTKNEVSHILSELKQQHQKTEGTISRLSQDRERILTS